ncbi:MAG TPA: ACP S-malonyltransferase [Deltaproteobacteria bacterium]|nr:ACP S-malonyltransferase [Deltaproteobacteria bacterium]
MPYCLIFPGQGTQFTGMSRQLRLHGALKDDLVRLMEHGPGEELDQTRNAQPAILSVCHALWEQSGYTSPDVVMGHSLGEYMALVAAGALTFEEAFGLILHRAACMEEAQPHGLGGMAAVMGLTADEVRSILDGVEDVWVANNNGASQVVISGRRSSLPDAMSILKERGAKRVVPLKVEVASHCPLMEPAQKALRAYLEQASITSPEARVVFNATAREASEPEAIRDLLAEQLTSPLLWEESVRHVVGSGIERFIEIGPKSVLAPLVKRIVPEAQVEVITSHEH